MRQGSALLGKIKEQLLARQAEMASGLSRSSSEKVSDGQVQDSGDEALSLTMAKLQDSLQQTEIDELRLIEDALNRINRDEYGICIDCAEPIGECRLENFPYAARCIICQEAFEE